MTSLDPRRQVIAEVEKGDAAEDAQSPAGRGLLARWAWVPVPLLLAAVVVLCLSHGTAQYPAPLLALVLNFLTRTLASVVIALLAARTFLSRRTPSSLLLACGIAIWGAASFITTALLSRPGNVGVTISNLGYWWAALCLLTGAALSRWPKLALRATGLWLASGLIAAGGVVGLVTLATLAHQLPTFFVDGRGGTPIRQVVLASAIAMFVLAAGLVRLQGRASASSFARWYSAALLLIAVALLGIIVESSRNTALDWTCRAAQYLGGVYLLAAAIASVRETRAWEIPLEEALRQSEAGRKEAEAGIAWLASFPESNPLPVMEVDAAGGVIYANPAAERALPGLAEQGWEHPWLAGLEVMPAELAPGETMLREVEVGGAWYQQVVTRVEPDHLRIYGADITAREQAEEALRESEERYRGLFEAMQEGMALLEVIGDPARDDFDVRYVEVNRYYEEVTGLARKDLIGRALREVLPTEQPGWFTAVAREALAKGATVSGPHLSVSGRWVLAHAYCPREGQVAVLLADITAAKQAEEALRESEARAREQAARWQAVLDAAPAMIWVASDAACTTMTGNRTTYEFSRVPEGRDLSKTGPTPERLQHFRIFRDGVELQPEEMPMQVVARTGVARREQALDFVFDDDTIRSVAGNVEPLFDAEGRPAGAIAAFIDVTEYRLAEEKAFAAERARTALAERMAVEIDHRVKNNLAMVSGLLQMQALEVKDGATLASLREAVARIRTFADLHALMYASRTEEVDLCEALRQVGGSTAKVFALGGGIDVEVRGEPCICAYRTATNLSVIANELITNALKYGAPGTGKRVKVRVSLSQSPEGLTLSVWNSGAPVVAGFDIQRAGRMGLRLVWDLAVTQYGGSFHLCPDGEGTRAEVSVPRAGLTLDEEPREHERPLWAS